MMLAVAEIAPEPMHAPADPERVAYYADCMLAGGNPFPPVAVVRVHGGGFQLCDGTHRTAAARALGHSHIAVEVVAGALAVGGRLTEAEIDQLLATAA